MNNLEKQEIIDFSIRKIQWIKNRIKDSKLEFESREDFMSFIKEVFITLTSIEDGLRDYKNYTD